MEQETYDAQAPLRFLTPAGDWQVEVFAWRGFLHGRFGFLAAAGGDKRPLR